MRNSIGWRMNIRLDLDTVFFKEVVIICCGDRENNFNKHNFCFITSKCIKLQFQYRSW